MDSDRITDAPCSSPPADTSSASPSSSLPSVIPLAPPPPPFSSSPPPPSSTHHLQNTTEMPQLPETRFLPSFVGQLDAFNRAALRQNKWSLILLLPQNPTSSTSSVSLGQSNPRPVWGPNAYHHPKRLNASPDLVDQVLFWRRTASTSDAQRYTAFFPVDGLPHLALLDPRSGERLAVWGNVDGQGMHDDGISDSLWDAVQKDLLEFLQHHSLENGALGPAHIEDKSWAVRTRRIRRDDTKDAKLPSTSVMDDEETAIAAAIAASLADARKLDDSNEDSASSQGSQEHDESDRDCEDIFCDDSSSHDEDDSTDSNTVSDDYGQDLVAGDVDGDRDSTMSSPEGIALTERSRPTAMLPPTRRAMLTPPRLDPMSSSVESLSSSYLERMESCFRSSTDSTLMETRKLRQEQDAELAASLREDRLREEKERVEVERSAMHKGAILAAASRLPNEPPEGVECLTIAVRTSAGKRIMRRFNNFDTLRNIADFAIAEDGCTSIFSNSPQISLRIAGIRLAGLGWDVSLGEVGLSRRTMVILNQ